MYLKVSTSNHVTQYRIAKVHKWQNNKDEQWAWVKLLQTEEVGIDIIYLKDMKETKFIRVNNAERVRLIPNNSVKIKNTRITMNIGWKSWIAN
jgi:hypothetical protein